jgi:hypothetical protein
VGVSETTVRRIWRKHGLKPHLMETFEVSNDPHLADKLEAIVGLYLNPPEHALVLCCDEKSQIQALDRTQPGLPLKPGRAGTMTHDYKRNGTATLFAALNTINGKSDQPVPGTPPASGMGPLPAFGQRRHARPQTTPSDRGQLPPQ